MRFLYLEIKDDCSFQYLSIGYNFFLLCGHYFIVSNHLIYIFRLSARTTKCCST